MVSILEKIRNSYTVRNSLKTLLIKENSARYISKPDLKDEALLQQQPSQKTEFTEAINYASKLVGYKSDISTLKEFFKWDHINFDTHLQKLIQRKHPLVDALKNLYNNGKYNMQSWELIILLVSKCAGYNKNVLQNVKESFGILQSQRTIARVAEMMRTSHLIHQSMVNYQTLLANGASIDNDELLGNQVSLLSGDHLKGASYQHVASLRNQDLCILISSIYIDFATSSFFGEADDQNIPIPYDPTVREKHRSNVPALCQHSDDTDNLKPITITNYMDCPEKEWTLRTILSSASFLGKCCQGAMMTAGNSEAAQKLAYRLGKYLAISWKAWNDMDPFLEGNLPPGQRFSLVSAPILFHLDYDRDLYKEIQKGVQNVKEINFQKVHEIVRKGPGLERTKEVLEKNSMIALRTLEEFPSNEANTALRKIICSMS